ncbi:hypothetical protein ACGFIV_01020 [Sphaerisporangium sp. NPDC049003]|uniref:hypothetical protein n=1 Tax=Sphaerisporangium sp. NPDC049003 TaxID=3364517 RepID=UPI00371119A4
MEMWTIDQLWLVELGGVRTWKLAITRPDGSRFLRAFTADTITCRMAEYDLTFDEALDVVLHERAVAQPQRDTRETTLVEWSADAGQSAPAAPATLQAQDPAAADAPVTLASAADAPAARAALLEWIAAVKECVQIVPAAAAAAGSGKQRSTTTAATGKPPAAPGPLDIIRDNTTVDPQHLAQRRAEVWARRETRAARAALVVSTRAARRAAAKEQQRLVTAGLFHSALTTARAKFAARLAADDPRRGAFETAATARAVARIRRPDGEP